MTGMYLTAILVTSIHTAVSYSLMMCDYDTDAVIWLLVDWTLRYVQREYELHGNGLTKMIETLLIKHWIYETGNENHWPKITKHCLNEHA